MTYLRSLLIIIMAGFLLSACELLSDDDNSDYKLGINNDVETLNQRIQIINQEITLDSSLAKAPDASMHTVRETFTHVATVASPVVNNKTLSATSIELRANKVYISYHLNGNEYAGAVDIIDVRDEEHPQIISSVTLENADVNALEIEENGKLLWITGGRDVSTSGYTGGDHKGAILGELTIISEKFKENQYREAPLPSFSGNDIIETGQNIYVAAGATGGGFLRLNKSDLKITQRINKDFAKSLDRRQGDIIGMNLNEDHKANFVVMDFNNGSTTDHQTPYVISPIDGKNVIEHSSAITYAALGDQGVKGYRFDINNDPVYEFNPQGEDVSNGVTVDSKYVYIAHGTDGLFIATRQKNNNNEPVSVYNWKGGSGSANFVKTNGKFVILANGVDGLNILKRVSK